MEDELNHELNLGLRCLLEALGCNNAKSLSIKLHDEGVENSSEDVASRVLSSAILTQVGVGKGVN